MKTNKSFFLLLLLLICSQVLVSQDSKIYFSVLGRRVSTVVGQDIVINGLYASNKDMNSFSHIGSNNFMPFNIAIDKKSNGKNIFLACANGVMRSTDFGSNWKILTSWEITEVQKVYLDPNNSNIIYLTSSFGVWKSTDFGETWIKKCDGLKLVSQTYNTCLAILPSNTNILYLGTANGIAISKNGGDSWETLDLSGREIYDIQIAPYDEKYMACGTEDAGVYVTTDGGKIWRQMNYGLKGNSIYTIAFDPARKGTIYCGGHLSGLNKSTDFGEKWIPYDNEINDKIIRAIVINPNKADEIYVGSLNYGLYKSSDGGKSFKCAAECDGRIWSITIQ